MPKTAISDTITQMELERAKEYSDTLAKLSSLRQNLKLGEDQLGRTVLVAPMKRCGQQTVDHHHRRRCAPGRRDHADHPAGR